jgi:hypothetical protein
MDLLDSADVNDAAAADVNVLSANVARADGTGLVEPAWSNEMWIGYESALPFGLYEAASAGSLAAD